MEESSTSDREWCTMYIVDLRRTVGRADSLHAVLRGTEGLWEALYDRMDAKELLWVIAPNAYRDGRLWPVAMAVAESARDVADFTLKNTISVHMRDDRGANMESAYDEILFFVKNKREYRFHKDDIRVAHVYKGHEWGGEREEGESAYHDTEVRRYNPDGKDPGNVWLEEDRTQTDDQTVDETRELSIQEAVRRCVLVGSNEGETVYVVGDDTEILDTIAEENRVAEPLDASVFSEEIVEQ